MLSKNAILAFLDMIPIILGAKITYSHVMNRIVEQLDKNRYSKAVKPSPVKSILKNGKYRCHNKIKYVNKTHFKY